MPADKKGARTGAPAKPAPGPSAPTPPCPVPLVPPFGKDDVEPGPPASRR